MKTLLITLLLSQQTGGVIIDVNTATKEELVSIQGMTPGMADRIIKFRPYRTVEDVHRGVTIFEFQKIQARLFVAPSSAAPRPVPSTPGVVTSSPTVRREFQVIQGNQIERFQFEPRKDETPRP